MRAKRADLSTGYPQALRASLRPRAKRARPPVGGYRVKKRSPYAASEGVLHTFKLTFFERSEKKLSTGYPQVIHALRLPVRLLASVASPTPVGGYRVKKSVSYRASESVLHTLTHGLEAFIYKAFSDSKHLLSSVT